MAERGTAIGAGNVRKATATAFLFADIDLGPEHAENAAMYVADWLRRFAALDLAMLLLDERWSGAQPLFAVDDVAYAPVANVAEHDRWSLGLRRAGGVTIVGSALVGAIVPEHVPERLAKLG